MVVKDVMYGKTPRKSFARYQEILDYAKEHKLNLHGFSYEMGINENVIDRIEDYIVQIEIPITG